MNLYILYIVGSFLLSMICGLVCIPAIIDFCVKKHLYDMPNARKIHAGGVPRLGGISFLPSMALAFLIVVTLLNNEARLAGRHIELNLWSIYFFVSLLIIYCVGFIDDIVGLKAVTKFIFQVIAASILTVAGLYINNLYGLFGIYDVPQWAGIPLTVFVIVFINNAMNLIDGIDGLSGALSLLALGGFLINFSSEGLWFYSVLIAGLMGVVLAFLYFNIFGRVDRCRKVFMGDTGSLTLGFILAFLLVKFSMNNTHVMPYRRDSLLLASTLLIVPVFDEVRIILVRLLHRCPIFGADKNHIHHKLMRAGLSQHAALLVIVSLSVLFIVINMLLAGLLPASLIVLVDIVVWIAFHQVVNAAIRRRGGAAFCRLKRE